MTNASKQLLDQAGEQRKSEQLDRDALQGYLLEQGVIHSPIKGIRQFSGGASNLTYQIETKHEDLILRRPPFGHIAKSAHDMKREYSVLNALSTRLSYCPEPVHYCAEGGPMDSEFYLMQRIRGVIIRRDMPEVLTERPDLYQRMCRQFLKTLVELHTVDPASVGLADFGKPAGYVRRQIEGWIRRMSAASTQGTIDFNGVSEWLLANQPDDSDTPAIIHNDYKFDNVIWDEQSLLGGEPRIVGVLDWEMATLGDPLMDLGTVLAYWVEASDNKALLMTKMMPTHLPGMMSRQEVADYYFTLRGWSDRDLSFYRVFGVFRLAVIVQQIYYRFDKGQTDNPKFAPMGDLANLLIRVSAKGAGNQN